MKEEVPKHDFSLDNDKYVLLNIFKNMYLCSCFDNSCVKQCTKVKDIVIIHIENVQENIPDFLDHAINYRDNR